MLLLPRLLAAAGLVLLLCVVPAVAVHAEGNGNGNGNGDGEGEADEAPQRGFAEAGEAARAFLHGVRDRDFDGVRRTVPPDELEMFDRVGQQIIDAIKIEELEVGETRRDENNENRALTYFRWKVEIEEEPLFKAALEDLARDLRSTGMDEDKIARLIAEQEADVRRVLRAYASELRKPQQRMILQRIDEKWFVREIIDQTYRPGGDDGVDGDE